MPREEEIKFTVEFYDNSVPEAIYWVELSLCLV